MGTRRCGERGQPVLVPWGHSPAATVPAVGSRALQLGRDEGSSQMGSALRRGMLARGTPWAHRALWAAWGTGPRRGPHPMRAPSPPRAHRVLWVWKPTPHGSQKTLVGGPTPHGSLPHRTGPTGPCGRTRPHQAPERGGGSGLHGSHGPHRALSRDLTHAGPIWILRRPRMSHTGPTRPPLPQAPQQPHNSPTPTPRPHLGTARRCRPAPPPGGPPSPRPPGQCGRRRPAGLGSDEGKRGEKYE